MVYLAACVSRAMGPTSDDKEREPLLDRTRHLLEKADYQVVFSDNPDNLCYDQPFASEGYAKQANDKRGKLLAAPFQASRDGLDPIYCGTNPYTLRLVQGLDDPQPRIHDPVKFIHDHLFDHLEFIPQDKPVTVHAICSTQHLGENQALINFVDHCTCEVVILEDIHCHGFAGDKGFATPELNIHSLRSLKDAVQFCEGGVSISRTCEINLSEHDGIDYRGVVYLVDRATQTRSAPRQSG